MPLRDDFQRYLEAALNKADRYYDKFGSSFQIGLLASAGAIRDLRAYGDFSKWKDVGDGSPYKLFGYPVIELYTETICNLINGPFDTEEIIEPVIICKDNYTFPMNAKSGDYIIWAGKLKQVYEIEEDELEGRSVLIKDIDGLSCGCFVFTNADELTNNEKWIKNIDNAAINEYLSSINIER